MKTGGLADVIGALPQALRKGGADIRIVMPGYSKIPAEYKLKMKLIAEIEVPVGWRQVYCGILELTYDGLTYYFIDNEDYFKRDGIYGYPDDGERFAFFSRAVLEMLRHVNFKPDVIHAHDWHTGAVGALLHKHYRHDPLYAAIGTVFTIHNLQFQGNFPYEVLGDLLGLDREYFTNGLLEYHNQVSFMKAGLVFSDHVTTVSPTYAEEIRTPYFGEGLDGELRYLGGKLTGILNGIDEKSYNPAADPYIFMRYRTNLAKKQENKLELQRELGLPERRDVPLIGMVSRITVQKGFDLVAEAMYGLMEHDDVQLVILGTGEGYYEHFLLEQSFRYPNKLSVQLRFDERTARQIYAASDIFLMPSQFEPCGISQMLAMRYGTLPVVRETGGLKDTVQSYNEFTGEGNGFTFGPSSAHDMIFTLRRALHFYHQPEHWKQIVRNAFSGDYSWGASARQYLDVYRQVAEKRQPISAD
jgi:starch synthase